MKTYMKLLILAAVLASFLVVAASGTRPMSPPSAGRAISVPGTYPLVLGATGDDHTNLLLSFAQAVALPLHGASGQEQSNTVTAQPSPAAQPPGMPLTGSADTTRLLTGLVGLALRLAILCGLIYFLRSRTHARSA